MPSVQSSFTPQQPPLSGASFDSTQTRHSPPSDTGRIIFTRQLWQRTMPAGQKSEESGLDKSQIANSQASHNNASESSKRATSTASFRARRHSPSPPGGSKTPLTPEESPPFRTTRKRSAAVIEQEDRVVHNSDTSPVHTRNSSSDLAAHVCICQRDPKIPRPRNAFILYRQHHQADIVAQNPGLANPEISKIIGEQWQNETADQKSKWKALAEEEKLRHQQQYPSYRYQPKRSGRRSSTDPPGSSSERPKCQKCAGRMILIPSVPYSTVQTSSAAPTPGSGNTTLTRTLPILRDLSLESPTGREMRASYSNNNNMAPNLHTHAEDRDEIGPLSPDSKRRRFNGDQPPPVARIMPPRYGAAPPGVAVGPGTPFPFGQPAPTQGYSPSSTSIRRVSLPGIRGVVSPPGPMAPPPRPGMGYQQHRLSQGHIHPDRSLTLPPLKSGHTGSISGATGSGKTADEQIMSISFRYKIKVLCQVAPPAPKTKETPRGPLIAVEGDTPEVVASMAAWLKESLSNGENMTVSLLNGPRVSANGGKEEAMAQYHRLAAEWLGKNKDILESITVKPRIEQVDDASMTDAPSGNTPLQNSRKIDEDYNDGDDASSSKAGDSKAQEDLRADNHVASRANSNVSETATTEKMDVDKRPSTTSLNVITSSTKPVTIIPNYSLYTSNLFARQITIGPNDPYAPNDHWQWTATLWRGIIGPDLTIYVRDTATDVTTGPSVEMEGVEGRSDVGLFIVRRVRGEGNGDGNGNGNSGEVEASVLRRVGFEVSEWVRAFGGGVQ